MKKTIFTFLFFVIFSFCLICFVSATDIFLEEIPNDLKFKNDTVTHFVVIDGEEFYTGSGNTINNFNSSTIKNQLEALGIYDSDLGTKYLTKIIIPNTYNGVTVTNADINNDKKFKSNIYFRNCGYLVFPSAVTQINDANEFNGQIRCIDFGKNSQITNIPGSFMYNASRLIRLLNMPNNLESIASSAFRNCSSLEGDSNKQLYINAKSILNKAFDNSLTNVESIIFGENVESLETESFSIGERDASKVKYIEFKCNVREVKFPNCNSGKYVGAFYFGTNDSQRRPYSNLVCIILSNPAQANCDGQTFIEASGQNVYFNDTVGDKNIVYTSHQIDKENPDIFYDDFLSNGTMTSYCLKCGKKEISISPALFKYDGISYPENGECKMTVGFFVFNDAFDKYERFSGNTIKFGIVAAIESVIGSGVSPLNEDGSAKNHVIKAEVGFGVASYNFILGGFTSDLYKNLKVLLATYVEIFDADENLTDIVYLQNKNVVNGNFLYVSYNDGIS